MSDLISRKALIKKFWEFTNGGKQMYLIPEEIWEMVELEPTAYDVRLVEKQIHEYFKGEVDSLNGEEPWDILKHNKAVCEIVEKGGVKNETD